MKKTNLDSLQTYVGRKVRFDLSDYDTKGVKIDKTSDPLLQEIGAAVKKLGLRPVIATKGIFLFAMKDGSRCKIHIEKESTATYVVTKFELG